MPEALAAQLELLPAYLGAHVRLAALALIIGIGVSIPAGLVLARRPRSRGIVLALSGVVQTIPSIAMLALMVPLAGIGFRPALFALVLYSILPVLRNTVTGVQQVDPALVHAATGLGMTDRQVLWRVQVPLALPVITAGVRTATVWVIGITTLATPVGATSLGNYIFSGLSTRNTTAILVGCVAAAVVALVVDAAIRALEQAISGRRPGRATAILAVLLAAIAGSFAPLLLDRPSADRPRIVVGTKTFTEQYVLGRLLEGRLDEAGFAVRRIDDMGSSLLFDGLVAGDVDCMIDYTGTIWANAMPGSEDPPGDPLEVRRRVAKWLADTHGIATVGALGFENTYALAVRREDAEAHGLETVDDLAGLASGWAIAGDFEFFGRPEWAELRSRYDLRFDREVGMDGALMYEALDGGEVDVAAVFSTDGRIAALDLVVLDDPRCVFPPYEAVILLDAEHADDPSALEALRPLAGSIDAAAMRSANRIVDVDRRPVEEAAASLEKHIRGDGSSDSTSPPS